MMRELQQRFDHYSSRRSLGGPSQAQSYNDVVSLLFSSHFEVFLTEHRPFETVCLQNAKARERA